MSKTQSAREHAKHISEGKEEPHHLGKQTSETLDMELFSLKNTKPAFRNEKWQKRFNYVEAEVNQIKDERTKQGLVNRLKAIRGGET